MQTWPRGGQTAQDDAFLQQNDPGAIACGRNCGGYTGYAAAYYDRIHFPRNGDGMGLLSDLLWFSIDGMPRFLVYYSRCAGRRE